MTTPLQMYDEQPEDFTADLSGENERGIKWFDSELHDRLKLETSKTKIEIPLYLYYDGVAFPTADMPIHIILENCRQMMNDIQHSGKFFGMVLTDEDGNIAEIGTCIQNLRRDILNDGTQICWNVCRNRFRILSIIQKDPYYLATLEYPIYDVDVLSHKMYKEKINDAITKLPLSHSEVNERMNELNDVDDDFFVRDNTSDATGNGENGGLQNLPPLVDDGSLPTHLRNLEWVYNI